MKFAQFQSTYKPLPIDTYERTGQELEAKYYKNKQDSSLLRQQMANAKVEDRNLGHLAKATTDVEGILANVHGKWQYAANLLTEARDRIVLDKALNASIEDYSKSQAEKQDQQKRLEEGKIGQEAVNAFYQYDKLYNNKPIEVDKNGQVINRWNTPTAPDKPDIDKKAIELVNMLLKNPDSVDSGLRQVLGQEGYLERLRIKGVADDKIFSVVKGWLANSEDVKDYYNYINNADLLSKTTTTDANGTTIQTSILPSIVNEYRQMGWNVDEQGNLIDNYQHFVNDRGEFDIVKDKKGKSMEITNAPKNIFESPNIKYLMTEGGLSAENALRQSYLSDKLNGQLNSIADGYRKFAFKETSVTDTIADQEHWLRRKMAIEKEASNAIAYSSIDKVPMYSKNYNISDAENTRKSLVSELEKLQSTPNSPRYREVQQALKDQTQNIVAISTSFAGTTDGLKIIEEQWQQVVNGMPANKQADLRAKYFKQFTEYLVGTGTLPDDNFTKGNLTSGYTSTMSGAGSLLGELGQSYDKFENAKERFQNALDKQLKNGIAVDDNYKIFKTADNTISKFHSQEGEYIKTHGDSYILPQNLDKQGQPIKFQDYINKTFTKAMNNIGYNPSWFDMQFFPTENTSTGYGQGVIKFIPNKNFPDGKKVPKLNPILVRPDASISNQVLRDRATYIYENSAEAPEVRQWAKHGVAMSIYGDTFSNLFNSLAVSKKVGGGQDLEDERTILNVPFGNQIFDMKLKPILVGNQVEYQLYIDPLSAQRNNSPYDLSKPVAAGYNVPDMIDNLFEQHTKALNVQ